MTAVLSFAVILGSRAASPEAHPEADCPECRELEQKAPSAAHEEIHDLPCARCHHPHENRSRDDWRQTCYEAGCHPRAWTETIYHRVSSAVFQDCMTCHRPHAWKAQGTDCLSCHSSIHGAEGLVPAPSLGSYDTFDHARHADLDCARCHETRITHSSLSLTNDIACMECHHSSESGKECSVCHAGRPPDSNQLQSLTIAGQKQSRSLAFSHERHQSLDCDTCHASGVYQKAETDCAGCHQDHHRTESDCASCHHAPPDGVHGLEIHTAGCQGSGCHAEELFTTLHYERTVCLSCHVDQTGHKPGQDCVSCHKISPEQTNGHGQ